MKLDIQKFAGLAGGSTAYELAFKDDVPTKTSQLTNDSGFITSIPTASSSQLGGVKVGAGLSINNGVLSATGGGTADSVDWSNVQNKPTKLSDFTNDSGFTTNTGTITGIKMNGASKGTSGVVDLGTVITAHQDISGKQDKITSTNKLAYSLISGTPTIPTVNNATLTIQKNGTNVQTFTANQSTNATANITVPTKTSELTNDSNFLTQHQDISGKQDKITSSNKLAYSLISGTPTIPTVNNGTLTIQQNGTDIQTFSANQSSNVSANIIVPTYEFSTGDNNGTIKVKYTQGGSSGFTNVSVKGLGSLAYSSETIPTITITTTSWISGLDWS